MMKNSAPNLKAIANPACSDPQATRPCLLVGFSSRQDITGLALAFDLLLAGMDKRKIPYRLIDFGRWGLAAQPGVFSWWRLIQTIQLLLSFCIQVIGVSTVYLVIASSTFGFLRDAMMIWSAHWLGYRLVLHLHGGGYRHFYEMQPTWLQYLIARTLAQADVIIVLGEHLCDQFAFVANIEQKLRIVPNGLPLKLQPHSVMPKSVPTHAPFRLLYLSNLLESKGYLKLLEACHILHHEYKMAIHCDFCGDFARTALDKNVARSAAQTHFFGLIATWNLADVVSYHGVVKDQKKEQFLRDAHLLILPTTYPWEGQPICIIEALAFATPVIATPHRGIPDQIINGYNGLLVASDPVAIANAVKQLWQDPSCYQQYSQQAQASFQKNFTQEQYLERLIPTILGTEQ